MTDNVNNAIHSPHDHFFRLMLRDSKVAKEFFQLYLPKDTQQLLNFDTLQLMNSSYIDANLRESVSDLLFQTSTHDGPAFLYLAVEHQSSPDRRMPLRMAKYTLAIMEQYEDPTREKPYPLVIPMVFYHGKRSYPYATDLKMLIAASSGLLELYYATPFQLIDLTQIANEELRKQAKAELIIFVLKNRYKRDLAPYLEDLMLALEVFWKQGDSNYSRNILYYVQNFTEITPQELEVAIKSMVSNEIRGEIMTNAEQYRQQGLQQGLEQGLQQGLEQGMEQGMERGLKQGSLAMAKKMIMEGVTLEFIAKITGLSLSEIKSLQDE